MLLTQSEISQRIDTSLARLFVSLQWFALQQVNNPPWPKSFFAPTVCGWTQNLHNVDTLLQCVLVVPVDHAPTHLLATCKESSMLKEIFMVQTQKNHVKCMHCGVPNAASKEQNWRFTTVPIIHFFSHLDQAQRKLQPRRGFMWGFGRMFNIVIWHLTPTLFGVGHQHGHSHKWNPHTVLLIVVSLWHTVWSICSAVVCALWCCQRILESGFSVHANGLNPRSQDPSSNGPWASARPSPSSPCPRPTRHLVVMNVYLFVQHTQMWPQWGHHHQR